MPKFAIIIVVIVILFNAIRIAAKASSHHFECQGCGAHFQVHFSRYMFTAHSFDGKCSVQCPKCGKTDLLAPLPGKE